jgi:hypothetical protein
MEVPMKAIEMKGTVDAQGLLHLDEPLSSIHPGRVRVLILVPDETDIDETEWLRGAARNPAFEFLNDPEEDIYTLADGRPFHVKG